jgi:Mg2+-importing ATPase
LARPAEPRTTTTVRGLAVGDATRLDVAEVFARLASSPEGLGPDEAKRRLDELGPNAIQAHGARPFAVLARQLKNPLLILLAAAAITSAFVGEATNTLIILGIVALSVGLGFFNEYRSERAVEELHNRIRHRTTVLRGDRLTEIDVTELVPGDVVELELGDVVPADVRLFELDDLECDEAVLTGESMPRSKGIDAQPKAEALGDYRSCAFMGTVVSEGRARGVVVSTGMGTVFGDIARQLGGRPVETAFQIGLRDFSVLLVRVTVVLTGSIFVINILLGRPLLTAALFSLAIAVGLTPQLLPAIVTISLSLGARRLAQKAVVVKRLVSIEDLGNIEVLFTDKTGTLTLGEIAFAEALDEAGHPADEILRLGLLCNVATLEDGRALGGNPLDRALLEAPAASAVKLDGFTHLAQAPFDHVRRRMSALMDGPQGRLVITKGAPESILEQCVLPPDAARATLERQFDAGSRVIAVATRPGTGMTTVTAADETGLTLRGFLVFSDPVKTDAKKSLSRLGRLGIDVKIVTGDNDRVARRLCESLGMKVGGTLNGAELDQLSDDALLRALPKTTIFARVSPEQKSRVIKIQRSAGTDVGFLGDGVNDAVALHTADVGISVDSATDVAKDAADIVLLEKDLNILAEGVVEGRRIFANTIKYVLMGTSSNFGNMFSAAGASLFLPFLPMTPTQILLNNLLYDVSEMTIPTDLVDEEMLRRPAHWDIRSVRRFMILFGPISSLFDFGTFAVMLWVFHASEHLFQTGWFVESLATQTLVVFLIRTRRVPFFSSRPSGPLLLASLAVVLVGAVLPVTPAGRLFDFHPLPLAFFAILGAMVVTYLLLVEGAKVLYFRAQPSGRPLAVRHSPQERRSRRLAGRWSSLKASRVRHTPNRPNHDIARRDA